MAQGCGAVDDSWLEPRVGQNESNQSTASDQPFSMADRSDPSHSLPLRDDPRPRTTPISNLLLLTRYLNLP